MATEPSANSRLWSRGSQPASFAPVEAKSVEAENDEAKLGRSV
jgi:hypothetical protein